MHDDPNFLNIAEDDEGPKHQKVKDSGFYFEDGDAVLLIKETLIGIPNLVQWDVDGDVMTIMLMDGSTVEVKAPIEPNHSNAVKVAERIRLATLIDAQKPDDYIIHHVPFSVQDY